MDARFARARPVPEPPGDAAASLLRAGETCWQVARADRAAFLIDAEAYFSALADALGRAERQVLMAGWDFHSRVRLRREGSGRALPDDLVGLLDALVRARRRLRIHVLGWDYSMLFALEREILPKLHFGSRTHRRLEFQLDSAHPGIGCHHQKIVVIDDVVAFAGGIDLTACRWDTREHRADDPRRTTPEGEPYAPFHDVQLLVEGEAAAALGSLVRERWHRVTSRRLPSPGAGARRWPERVAAPLRDVRVGIARTAPAYEGRPEVREIERLYVESIAAARQWIYAENQYLTSHRIAGALEARLREPHGPEVVLVVPHTCSGWLEEASMGALRARLVTRLRAADRYDRLRVYYPEVPGLAADDCVQVHAKVMVVDDRFARVGSSNLSNRSLGVDTECDLAIGWDGREDVARAIDSLRDDLLGEHLGVGEAAIRATRNARGSLVAAIEAHLGGARTLRPLRVEPPSDEHIAAAAIADPEAPFTLSEVIASTPAPPALRRLRTSLGTAGALLGIGTLAAACVLTPLGAWLTPSVLRDSLGTPSAELVTRLGAAVGAALAGVVILRARRSDALRRTRDREHRCGVGAGT